MATVALTVKTSPMACNPGSKADSASEPQLVVACPPLEQSQHDLPRDEAEVPLAGQAEKSDKAERPEMPNEERGFRSNGVADGSYRDWNGVARSASPEDPVWRGITEWAAGIHAASASCMFPAHQQRR